MKRFPQCEEYRNDVRIVLQENRSKILFLNHQKADVIVMRVDGCVIDDPETLRCDYALIPCDDVEIYVELKGSDIPHAVKQLESTIQKISDSPRKTRKLCFVVSTRVPKQTTTIQKLQGHFKTKFNASFRVKNIQDEYDLALIQSNP
jgi:hypothetical protein